MLLIFSIFFITLVCYLLFSYILTEPNLVLSSYPAYWNFQTYMWNTFYSNSTFITATYVFLIAVLFFCYIWIVIKLKRRRRELLLQNNVKYVWIYTLIIFPLFFSYNALSHDIFNYMFNARMVLVYGANPHIKTALDYAEIDSWVRFMHNIHTTAPYGYGWTILSLLPSFFGMGKFLPTLLLFRLFMIGSIGFLYVSVQHLSQTLQNRQLYLHELAFVFLNPLLVIEVISNYHNDLWMMAPAVLGVSLLLRTMKNLSLYSKHKKTLFLISAVLLLVISIAVKLVTVVLVPLFLFGVMTSLFLDSYANLIQKRFKLAFPVQVISKLLLIFCSKIEKFIPVLVIISLFIPLFTARSQQFLPWYVLWLIPWLPFIKSKTLRNVIVLFSLTSLLRYVPWLYNSYEYSDEIIMQQKLTTWLLPITYLFSSLKITLNSVRKIIKV